MKETGMKRIPRNERGMALAVAIFALVVVGALVAGAFFAGTQEQRVGENQRRVQTSFGVAEAGAQERVLTWDPNTMNKGPVVPVDSVAIVNTPAPNGTGSYAGYSFRVGTNLFLIDVTGRDNASAAGAIAGGGGARQRIGMLARIAPVQFGIRASLTTQGQVAMSGNANIVGVDQIPTGWVSCDTTGPSQAGVCDKNVLTNWGDGENPNAPCASYWPIIHATGTITLNNTQGQGILLVDGDLNVQGSYQFFGIVVIQGDLKTAGGGNTDAHFWGGVMAKNADLSTQSLSGKATLNFSSCAILTALQATSPISMMRSRCWAQLF